MKLSDDYAHLSLRTYFKRKSLPHLSYSFSILTVSKYIRQNLFNSILTSELTEKQKATLDNQLKLNSNGFPDGMYFLKLFIR
jgi:hypothetical protein